MRPTEHILMKHASACARLSTGVNMAKYTAWRNPGHMGQGVRCKRYAARARLTPRPREYHMKRTAGSSPVMPCAGFWTCHAAKSPMRPMRMGLRAAARKCCTFTSRARRGCPPLSRRRHTRLSNRSGRRCAPGAGRPDRCRVCAAGGASARPRSVPNGCPARR